MQLGFKNKKGGTDKTQIKIQCHIKHLGLGADFEMYH